MSIHVTDDEVDRRAREMREKRAVAMKNGDYHLFDKNNVVNPKPGKSYRGAYLGKGDNKGRRIEELKAEGWVITDPKSDTSWPIKMEANGGLVNGDLILMETDRQVHVDSLARGRVKQMDMEGQPLEQTKDTLNRIIRDELGGKPHTNYVENTSGPGEDIILTSKRK